MAACSANWQVWPIFDERWKSALREGGAPYLHMREFAHRVEAFKGWSEPQRRKLMARCVEALNGLEIIITAAVLRTSDYHLLTPEQQRDFVDPLFCCFHECLNALDLDGYRFQDGQTKIFYSRQDEYSANMKRLFRFLKERTGLAQRLNTLEFRDMRTSPGLQLADLVAYELRHYYHRRHTAPQAPTRFPLQAICDHQTKAGVALFKYIPGWALRIKAARAWVPVQEVMWSLASDWEPLLQEQIPDCVGLKGVVRMHALDNRRQMVMRELARYRWRSPS